MGCPLQCCQVEGAEPDHAAKGPPFEDKSLCTYWSGVSRSLFKSRIGQLLIDRPPLLLQVWQKQHGQIRQCREPTSAECKSGCAQHERRSITRQPRLWQLLMTATLCCCRQSRLHAALEAHLCSPSSSLPAASFAAAADKAAAA